MCTGYWTEVDPGHRAGPHHDRPSNPLAADHDEEMLHAGGHVRHGELLAVDRMRTVVRAVSLGVTRTASRAAAA